MIATCHRWLARRLRAAQPNAETVTAEPRRAQSKRRETRSTEPRWAQQKTPQRAKRIKKDRSSMLEKLSRLSALRGKGPQKVHARSVQHEHVTRGVSTLAATPLLSLLKGKVP